MSPPPATLDDGTIAAIRSALGDFVRDGDQGSQLRDALGHLAGDAKAKGISAEHLLIVLKNLVSSLPEMREVKEPAEREKLKQRIITACIEQYYRK